MLNILIVKLSAIGDVIHCLPVAHALKQCLPDARISWLVEPASQELLENNPCIDEVIVFRAKKWLKDANNPGSWLSSLSEANSFFQTLQERKFDAALEMQGLLKSSLLTTASGAKIRIGFAETREFADSFLTHKVNVGDYFGHYVPVVELNLKIAEAVIELLGKKAGQLPVEFCLPPITEARAEKINRLLWTTPENDSYISSRSNEPSPSKSTTNSPIGNAPVAELVSPEPSTPWTMPIDIAVGANTRKLCAIIPGTTWVTKIWPVENWLSLCQRLSKELGYRLVLIGGKSEREMNTRLCEQLRILADAKDTVDLTGQTSLMELAAVFDRCDLVVGGDTGPLHLAAATGNPKVLGIYGSTPWRRNGPYGAQCRSVSLGTWCQPCYSKTCAIQTVACLRTLDVEQVFSAVQQLIGRSVQKASS